MKRTERLRIAAKAVEFRLPPRLARALAPLVGLRDPILAGERALGCIFVHVPKAAGTSVARALFDSKSRHVGIARYYAFDPAFAEGAFKFSFVRNPWDRFLSAYHYLARRIGADPRFPDHRWATHYLGPCGDFEGFVRKMAADARFRREIRRYIHFRDQFDWLAIPGRGMRMDYIGRFETIERDFAHVCQKVGSTALLPHERKGQAMRYQDAYDGVGVELVGDLYRRDIAAFGYRFGD